MGRGRPVGSRGLVCQVEDQECLQCELRECLWSDEQHAKGFWLERGRTPCRYWAVRWERTGWIRRQGLRSAGGRGAEVAYGYVEGLRRQVDRAVREVIGEA